MPSVQKLYKYMKTLPVLQISECTIFTKSTSDRSDLLFYSEKNMIRSILQHITYENGVPTILSHEQRDVLMIVILQKLDFSWNCIVLMIVFGDCYKMANWLKFRIKIFIKYYFGIRQLFVSLNILPIWKFINFAWNN